MDPNLAFGDAIISTAAEPPLFQTLTDSPRSGYAPLRGKSGKKATYSNLEAKGQKRCEIVTTTLSTVSFLTAHNKCAAAASAAAALCGSCAASVAAALWIGAYFGRF